MVITCGFICKRYYGKLLTQVYSSATEYRRASLRFFKPRIITYPITELKKVESVINVSDLSLKQPVARCETIKRLIREDTSDISFGKHLKN